MDTLLSDTKGKDIVYSMWKHIAEFKARFYFSEVKRIHRKRLPFKADFDQYTITDPLQVMEAFEVAESKPEIHTIVIDSLTYLMDMYESLHVLTLTNKMEGWSKFAQYFKTLMQMYCAKSTKRIIFTAHTLDSLNESEMVLETKVPIKGALKNQGIESYFAVVIAAKKIKIKDLEKYKNDLLTITPEEEILGFKHVFQTKLTKETVNERLRGPLKLFSIEETYTDNNIQLILDRLEQYYA